MFILTLIVLENHNIGEGGRNVNRFHTTLYPYQYFNQTPTLREVEKLTTNSSLWSFHKMKSLFTYDGFNNSFQLPEILNIKQTRNSTINFFKSAGDKFMEELTFSLNIVNETTIGEDDDLENTISSLSGAEKEESAREEEPLSKIESLLLEPSIGRRECLKGMSISNF